MTAYNPQQRTQFSHEQELKRLEESFQFLQKQREMITQEKHLVKKLQHQFQVSDEVGAQTGKRNVEPRGLPWTWGQYKFCPSVRLPDRARERRPQRIELVQSTRNSVQYILCLILSVSVEFSLFFSLLNTEFLEGFHWTHRELPVSAFQDIGFKGVHHRAW